jgi:small-conductance mechanosensitive channel
MYEWGTRKGGGDIFLRHPSSYALHLTRARICFTEDSPLPDLRHMLVSLGLAAGAVVVALVVQRILVAIGERTLRRRPTLFFQVWVKYAEDSTRIILPLLALLLIIPWLPIEPAILSALAHAVGLALIAAIGWRTIKMVAAIESYIAVRHPVARTDLMSHRLGTQVQVLRHIATVVIAIMTVSIMLMTFPNIRHLGETLFASAGLAAIVFGVAAQSTLSNLLAGVQLALTQPIRLEDAVVVEGEWGWIEEITTTYVVVRIWDLRRLVLPLSYFIQKPFQNWTRQSSDLLGTVFLYADYTVPVHVVREELHRVLETSGMWDGKVWGLQVTNLSERAVELRALMSAPGSSEAWDLRCHVREKMVEFLQEHYPHCLPRARAELAGQGGDNGHGPSEGISAVA